MYGFIYAEDEDIDGDGTLNHGMEYKSQFYGSFYYTPLYTLLMCDFH